AKKVSRWYPRMIRSGILLGYTAAVRDGASMATIYSFADLIRQRRSVLGLTQAALAARVGCALVTIKKIEQETRHPSPELAELLCIHLAIPADERAAFLRLARGTYGEATVSDAQVMPP